MLVIYEVINEIMLFCEWLELIILVTKHANHNNTYNLLKLLWKTVMPHGSKVFYILSHPIEISWILIT